MNTEFDYLVLIGRFQPFHNGHASVILEGMKRSRHVITLIGSSNVGRSWRNPFTFEERESVIQKWWEFEGIQYMLDYYNKTGTRQPTPSNGTINSRLITLPLDDYVYNDQGWITSVQKTVETAIRATEKGWTDYPPKIGLIGHNKDHSSYYLRLFPQWGNHVDVSAYTKQHMQNATEIREVYFGNAQDLGAYLAMKSRLPNSTIEFLDEFRSSKDFMRIYDEHRYIAQYREDHQYVKNHPYEPTHTTVDAVVIQSGHILLIERGKHPGIGQWALPGGFIKPNETLKDGMLRELWEETKIKVDRRILERNIKNQMVFDDPHRSARGRIFSHAFLIVLDPQIKLPKVKGRSDARKAWWQPLGDLDSTMFFEDHFHIINKLAGGL